MKEADRVREVAENSTGSAWREQEKWAKSLQGHLGSLSASWEKLATLSLNSDFVKGFIDATKCVLDLTSALGGLVPIAITVSVVLTGMKFHTLGLGIITVLTKIPLLNTGLNSLLKNIILTKIISQNLHLN